MYYPLLKWKLSFLLKQLLFLSHYVCPDIFLKSNIIQMVRHKDKFIMVTLSLRCTIFMIVLFHMIGIVSYCAMFHNRKLYLTYGMVLFGDLDWPPNAPCRFVSISWASCFLATLFLQYVPKNTFSVTFPWPFSNSFTSPGFPGFPG